MSRFNFFYFTNSAFCHAVFNLHLSSWIGEEVEEATVTKVIYAWGKFGDLAPILIKREAFMRLQEKFIMLACK